jgi:hypothetical protein
LQQEADERERLENEEMKAKIRAERIAAGE